MGQYQQWLLCQETDRSLRRKLEALEAERASLLERLSELERAQPRPENQLVRLLLNALGEGEEGQQRGQQARAHLSPSTSVSSGAVPGRSTGEVISNVGPVGPARTPLPAMNSELPAGTPPAAQRGSRGQLESSVKLQELELPEWLHRLTISSGKDRRPGPIDEERIRTNRLVQRWLERWGRLPSSPPVSQPPTTPTQEDATQN
ncbi:MAG: hypothetical protein IRZ24_11045 [Thermogemmatispora sp.]|nr:hypothetical protein [Thermogemmatispora sp.]MBX5450594.1 hypothetical protein [Thermogemmatispora sp.]